MKEYVVKKYEISCSDGNFIQAGETMDRKSIQIMISCPSAERQRMENLIVLLNKTQWNNLCELRYSLTVKDEETSDANS